MLIINSKVTGKIIQIGTVSIRITARPLTIESSTISGEALLPTNGKKMSFLKIYY